MVAGIIAKASGERNRTIIERSSDRVPIRQGTESEHRQQEPWSADHLESGFEPRHGSGFLRRVRPPASFIPSAMVRTGSTARITCLSAWTLRIWSTRYAV